MKYVPTFNKVQIKLLEEVSESRLIADVQLFSVAEIIAVGEAAGYRAGHKLQSFSVGQKVIVRKGAVATISTKNESLTVIDDDQIVTVLLEESNG